MSSKSRSLTRNITANINPKLCELQVLACVPISAMLDTACFAASSCFCCMFTGNTLFVALGASYMPKTDPYLWLRSLVALGAFWTGCFMFARLRYFGASRKIVLFGSMLFQAILIFIAAAISQAHKVSGFDARALGPPSVTYAIDEHRTHDQRILVPLALLGFQAGGQIVMTRVLKVNYVPINVLTSLYCDFLSDPGLFSLNISNVKRSCRFGAIFSYFGGVIGAGWLLRTKGGIPAVLWLCAGMKAVLSIVWLLWPAEKGEPEEKVPAA